MSSRAVRPARTRSGSPSAGSRRSRVLRPWCRSPATIILAPIDASGETVRALAGQVRGLIEAADLYHRSVSAAMGISAVEASALEFLLHNGPRPPSLIAARTGLSRTSTTALVDRLADAGWVAREPHPTDRRSVLVALTDDGFDVVLSTYLLFAEDIGTALARADPRLRDDRATRLAVSGLLGAMAAALRRRAGDRLGVDSALADFRGHPAPGEVAGPS